MLVKIGEVKFSSDLFPLEMDDLDVILEMDWLNIYKAIIDCEEQSLTLSGPRGRRLNIGVFLRDRR